jgi:hypothetical protein
VSGLSATYPVFRLITMEPGTAGTSADLKSSGEIRGTVIA